MIKLFILLLCKQPETVIPVIIKLLFNSFLTTMTEVVTVWGFVFELPNFIKKLRVENNVAIAAEAIKLLPNLNKDINEFLRSAENTREASEKTLWYSLAELQLRINMLPLNSGMKDEFQKKLIDPLIRSGTTNEHMEAFFASILGLGWLSYRKGGKLVTIPLLANLNEELNRMYTASISRPVTYYIGLVILIAIINLIKNIY